MCNTISKAKFSPATVFFFYAIAIMENERGSLIAIALLINGAKTAPLVIHDRCCMKNLSRVSVGSFIHKHIHK